MTLQLTLFMIYVFADIGLFLAQMMINRMIG
jgi:hypothetical protein